MRLLTARFLALLAFTTATNARSDSTMESPPLPLPRTLQGLPGKETVLINKEVQGGLGRERYTIEYAPGETVVGNIFNPDTGETAFTVCDDQGLDEAGENVVLFCRTKTPNDAEFVDFSFPPNPPTLFPKSFLGVGTEVLLPGDRYYPLGSVPRKLADCRTLAGRVPKIVTRLLGDCYASSAAPTEFSDPDYATCRAVVLERHRALYQQLVDAGCLLPGPMSQYERDTDGTYAVLADAYQAADERARPLGRWVQNGDGTATDTTSGLQWELKTDYGSVHDKDNGYTWCVDGNDDFTCDNGSGPDGSAFTEFLAELNENLSTDGSTTGGCFASHCDWRLPTIVELQSLFDFSSLNCDGMFLPCTTIPGLSDAGPYWSSSILADYPQDNAWAVAFTTGHHGGKWAVSKSFSYRVRAVRGGS